MVDLIRSYHREKGPFGSLNPDYFRVKNETLIMVGNESIVTNVGTFSSISVLKHALESEQILSLADDIENLGYIIFYLLNREFSNLSEGIHSIESV